MSSVAFGPALRFTAIAGGVLLLAACSGGSGTGSASSGSPGQSPPSASTPAAPSANGTATAVANDEGCAVAEVTTNSSNAALQELALSVYRPLLCAGSSPLTAQLKAAVADPVVAAKAKTAGATLTSGEAAGGVTVNLVSGRSGCQVVVMDNPPAKMVNCADV
jgi:hypothetical protein